MYDVALLLLFISLGRSEVVLTTTIKIADFFSDWYLTNPSCLVKSYDVAQFLRCFGLPAGWFGKRLMSGVRELQPTKMKTLRNQVSARSGLTLIELVVVLAVLVALAGLIIGNFPGIIRKASRSSSATSVQDVSRAVQYMYTTTLKYPTGFDSLLESPTVLYNKLPSANGILLVGGQLTASTVNATEAAALVAIGVTTTLQHAPSVTTDVTWTSTTPGQVTNSFNGTYLLNVVTITTNTAFTVFKADVSNYNGSNRKFLIFGVGAGSSMVGPAGAMLEAPVHYGADASQNPKDFYQRYAVCFELDATGSTTVARYIGAAAIEGSGLTATDTNVKEYWKN